MTKMNMSVGKHVDNGYNTRRIIYNIIDTQNKSITYNKSIVFIERLSIEGNIIDTELHF